MLEVILLALLSFSMRSILAFRHKWIGLDTLGYMSYGIAIKEAGKMVFRPRQLKVRKEEDFFIPQLFCVFLSWFPKKHYDKLRFLSPAIDTAIAVILYFFTSSILGPNSALVAMAVYVFSPVVFYTGLTTTPRSFSNFFFTIGTLSLYYYFANDSLLFLLPFFITSMIILPCHRLTTQATVIMTLIISVVFLDALPALTLLTSFAVLWVGTENYKNIAKDHIKKLASYAKHGGFRTGKLVPENPITLFSSLPFMVLILAWYFMHGMLNLPLIETWFIGLLILSFVWVLGEGFRYLTFAAFPVSILSAAILASMESFVISGFIATLFLAVSSVGIWKIIRTYVGSHRIIDKDAIRCFEWLKENAKTSETMVALPFDYHYSLVAIFFSGVNCVGAGYTDKEVMEKGIAAGFNIDWVVTNDKKFKKLSRFKEKFKHGKFYVFKKVR